MRSPTLTSSITCSACSGSGKVRATVQTTSLSSAQPTYEDRPCDDCLGTGRGVRASAAHLRHYYTEGSQSPEDLFALARSVAASTAQPRTKETTTAYVQVPYGLLGRKSRTETVVREAETDYWVLATKTGWQKRTGGGKERGGTVEEEDNKQTIFCLAADGSFRKLRRKQECVVWDNYRYEEMGWSAWEPQSLRNLDHFMVDFDFNGNISAESPGYWSERTEVVGDMDFYIERGNEPFMRQIYPKGVGLYNALNSLRA